MRGGCFCGRVRYEVTGKPFNETSCHCSMCRRSAGAPFVTWFSVRPSELHFSTGEPIARVSRANGGLIQRDMRKAQHARDALRKIPIDELIDRVGKAGDLYANAELPMGDGTQTPDQFVRAQSADRKSVV